MRRVDESEWTEIAKSQSRRRDPVGHAESQADEDSAGLVVTVDEELAVIRALLDVAQHRHPVFEIERGSLVVQINVAIVVATPTTIVSPAIGKKLGHGKEHESERCSHPGVPVNAGRHVGRVLFERRWSLTGGRYDQLQQLSRDAVVLQVRRKFARDHIELDRMAAHGRVRVAGIHRRDLPFSSALVASRDAWAINCVESITFEGGGISGHVGGRDCGRASN